MNESQMFANLLKLDSPRDRAIYLDEICAGDLRLRADMEALLRAHSTDPSFLEHRVEWPGATVVEPSVSAAPDGTRALAAAEQPGLVLAGRYRLLEMIGEGGMGTVWMAEQTEPLKRLVAVKLIKAGLSSKAVLARFEAERQALALMDHPNIAKILDAGAAPDGRPFFVMELVKGVPMTRFCDEHRLTPNQRLELFVPVCQAVQHAHQKGIIHRDLKPSNVLVAQYDLDPVPKVIDFGVAKATGQALTERTLYTGFGAVVGTVEYMSPEQASFNQIDVDTRSDIHALGVLLYELLTGSPPFSRQDLERAGILETLRIIREQEPSRPSTKLSTAEGLPRLAANRGTEPSRLTALLRGELDWIVMKALDKDRNRRYESASAFAADVQRYLRDEPVQACPPSGWYRLRKLAVRHKRIALTACFVVALLGVAVGSLGVSYGRVQDALRDKTRALDREQQTNYLQSVALAGRELAAGNVGRAEELLDDCPADRRGWEWHFLKRQRYSSPRILQHPATVVRVAYSPDGRQLASVCMDGTFQLWDARTGEPLHTLGRQMVLARGALCRGLAYSPDGRYLAAAGHDGLVQIWEASSGELRQTLKGHKGAAWQVAFSPDSRDIASAGADRTVRLWQVESGKSIRVFSELPAPVKGVAFRPDGRSVVAACDNGKVTVFDRETGRETFSFRCELLPYPYSAWFSQDGRLLAWSCLDGMIKIWDTTTGQLKINQQSNTHQCRAVAFSPDGKRIALAGFDGTLRLLDTTNGREMLTIFAHPSLIADAAFSNDGNQIASVSYDHTLRIWDGTPLDGDPLADHCVTLTGHKQLVSGVAFSSDGRWLASSSWDATVKLWERVDSATPKRLILRYTLRGHQSNVIGVAFSSDQRTVVTGSWDKTVKLWDLGNPTGDTLTELRTIHCKDRVAGLAVSPDGRLVAIGLTNGISLFDATTGEPAAPFKRTLAPVPALVFTADSRRLVSAGASDPTIKVWDVCGERPLFEIRHNSNPNASVAISPDGGRVASPGRDEAAGAPAVKVWDAVDWNAGTYSQPVTLQGHLGYVWKVAFTPDGRYLASGSWDSTIKIWDLEAPPSTEPVTLRGHAGFIHGLAFSPDGALLASASGSARHGEVKVWDASLWKSQSKQGR